MTSLLDRGPPSAPRSLYVHVPFCTDRCTYCAFATIADRPALHAELVQALVLEYDRQARRPLELDTLYLGGGTPGLLSIDLLGQLLRELSVRSPRAAGAEVTLEINPSNVTPEAISGWRDLGISRLSMGIQTFDDQVLASLGRHHDGTIARRALDLLAADWGDAWSADLLVGWAGQTEASLQRDVQLLLTGPPPHISVYGLTIEPGTPLHARHLQGDRVSINNQQMDIYDSLWSSQIIDRGFERYEVSNFARSGARSRHNQVYWRNSDYVGIGPGASSSYHPLRWSNIRDTQQYLRQLDQRLGVRQRVERLTPAHRLLESLGVGLRTQDGLDVRELDRRFGVGWRTAIARGLDELSGYGLLEELGGRLRVPSADLTKADSVANVLARTLDVPDPPPDLPAHRSSADPLS